jgi:hypothetical protein
MIAPPICECLRIRLSQTFATRQARLAQSVRMWDGNKTPYTRGSYSCRPAGHSQRPDLRASRADGLSQHSQQEIARLGRQPVVMRSILIREEGDGVPNGIDRAWRFGGQGMTGGGGPQGRFFDL